MLEKTLLSIVAVAAAALAWDGAHAGEPLRVELHSRMASDPVPRPPARMRPQAADSSRAAESLDIQDAWAKVANSTAATRAELESVREKLSGALATDPRPASLHLMRAAVNRRLFELHKDGQAQKAALEDYEAYARLRSQFAQDRNLPTVWLTIGIMRLEQGKRDESAEALKKVIAGWPTASEARTAKALLLLSGVDQ